MLASLPGFPLVNQQTKVTGDGRPSNNGPWDCVAASIDAMCRYLLQQPENSIFNPDSFKDHAYSEIYTGGTDARNYVAYCLSLGIDLVPVEARSTARAVDLAHSFLQAGMAVLFTEVDPYAPNASHVCVWHAESPGGLIAADPFVVADVTHIDTHWQPVLVSSELWVAKLNAALAARARAAIAQVKAIVNPIPS